ncbi:hypothetical protein DID88_010101 [Monilinia fructigena]|uniref:Uncharacterized protein n=1 Tax=Monilinia fructigena TaxID=38457 RepID=A0A395IL48_9HELO|nr:hypothetical protein DID88_010101 [Monilinia fructigena]
MNSNKDQHSVLWPNGFKYNGQLLRLALDLAERLLPAFYIPQPVVWYWIYYLSRLTGDPRFEQLAKRAFWAVWNRRSPIGLIGAGIDAETGQWIGPYAGIGAVQLTTRHYVNVHLITGSAQAFWIDSLGAYYPGLLTLAGEVEEAIETSLYYTALWTRSLVSTRWRNGTEDIKRGVGRHVAGQGLQDVRTGEKSEPHGKFFLGETAKYLYLLFDPDHPMNDLDAAYVFTTEGHPLVLPRENAKPPPRTPTTSKAVQPDSAKFTGQLFVILALYRHHTFTFYCLFYSS